jgi:hypothetical protein
MQWTKGARMRRQSQGTKFAVGFKDDRMMKGHKFTNAVGSLRWKDLGETNYFESLTKIKNENSRNLNTKCIAILLRSSANACVSHADKPINGYGHWKTAQGEILAKIWKQIGFFDDRRRFGSRT